MGGMKPSGDPPFTVSRNTRVSAGTCDSRLVAVMRLMMIDIRRQTNDVICESVSVGSENVVDVLPRPFVLEENGQRNRLRRLGDVLGEGALEPYGVVPFAELVADVVVDADRAEPHRLVKLEARGVGQGNAGVDVPK